MTVSGTNFGKAAKSYGKFRAGFPDSLFDRLAGFDVGLPRQSVVDLGTGTGTLARGFAVRGCTVVGVDPDLRLTEQAKELDSQQGVSITYVEATAESTTLEDNVADVVAAGQCWHWFDRPQALREVIRVLRPEGKLVIAHFDWLPLPGNVVEATEELIEQHNSDWHLGGGMGMYPQWLPDLGAAGFRDIETFSYDLSVSYNPQAWRGRIQASAGIAALDAESARDFDAELEAMLATQFPSSPLPVPHRIFSIVAKAPE